MSDQLQIVPKSRSLKPLRALWPYLRPYKRTLVLAMLALLIASGAMLVLPLAFRDVIDKGMAVQDRATIDLYFVAFLGAAAVFGVFAALRFYLVTWLGERVVADLRADIYRRVIRMDPTFFEVTKHGRGAVATDDRHDAGAVDRRRESVDHVALDDSIGRRTGAADRDEPVACRVDSAADSAGHRAADRRRAASCATLSRESQDRVADTSGLAGETLNAIQTVQAFTLEKLHSDRYGEAVEAFVRGRRAAHHGSRSAHRSRHDDRFSAASPSCCGKARIACSQTR